jgi:hypothetical protein
VTAVNIAGTAGTVLGLVVLPASDANAAAVFIPCTAGRTEALNAAIEAANNKAPQARGEIVLASKCTYTISEPFDGENGLTEITDTLRISSMDDATIARSETAQRSFRILSIGEEGVLGLNRITIRNGDASSGGGIRSAGHLTLNNSTVEGNSATFGGGIANHGVLTLNHTAVRDGSAQFGGGIYNDGGSADLNLSTVTSNTADGNGGGIYNEVASDLTLAGGSVTGNSSGSRPGGGIYNSGTVATTETELARNTPDDCYPSGSVPGCSH